MHARELLELAALVAEHGAELVRGEVPIPDGSIEAYWSASRCRLDRWQRDLKRRAAETGAPRAGSSGPDHSALGSVVEEVLTGEVLTRVWTAAMCAVDRRRGSFLAEPVVRSILASHVEARHRVLTLLVNGSGMAVCEAARLDQLRRRSERWTDVLLGQLAVLGSVGEFAFDPERVEDFAADFAMDAGGGPGRVVCPLMINSMRASFRSGLARISPNADLNAKVAASIVRFFPPALFEVAGVPESLWMLRVSQTTSAAEGLIGELLFSDRSATDGGGSLVL